MWTISHVLPPVGGTTIYCGSSLAAKIIVHVYFVMQSVVFCHFRLRHDISSFRQARFCYIPWCNLQVRSNMCYAPDFLTIRGLIYLILQNGDISSGYNRQHKRVYWSIQSFEDQFNRNIEWIKRIYSQFSFWKWFFPNKLGALRLAASSAYEALTCFCLSSLRSVR